MRLHACVTALLLALVHAAAAQQGADTTQLPAPLRAALRVQSIQIEPLKRSLTLGDTVDVTQLVRAAALDASGSAVPDAPLQIALPDRIVTLVEGRRVAAIKPGTGDVRLLVPKALNPMRAADFVVASYSLTVEDLPAARLQIVPPKGTLYAGTALLYEARAYVAGGRERERPKFSWTVDNPRIAGVDELGRVTGRAPGTATLTVKSGAASASERLVVRPNTIAELRVKATQPTARTGDVVHFSLAAFTAARKIVPGVVPFWSVAAPAGGDDVGARVWPDGGFVAEKPGNYTVVATVGERSATANVIITARAVGRPVRLTGRAIQTDHSTSELHVWTGRDGRDYAYVGTHADGVRPDVTGNVVLAYDVTDPTRPVLTDSVVVNARVINDVLVNQEGTLGVLTREGAADRKNGIVLLDVSVPAHPKILTEYTENLTSGIHNTWFYKNVVYLTNDGTTALHIIDVSDPHHPHEVGRWETGDPSNRYLHDVWVHDGIMYLSYWDDGVQILDVGGLKRGGTPERPVFVSKFVYPIGHSHNVWRDRNYLFVGDEIFGCAECINGPRGYVHVADLSDIDHPVEVAKFEVPEAGTHNFWSDGDGKLYIAYYQGGLRVVDISGELRGDLYRQGRQIGWYHTADDKGFIPNAPFAWGPQPHKGNIFVSDMNSGLWIMKLDEQGPLIP